jgi:hypothetical protein
MNTLTLWLLFLLLLSELPMTFRDSNCVFLGHSVPVTSDPNPSLFISPNASQRIIDELVVAKNLNTNGDFGESDYIPVIKMCH